MRGSKVILIVSGGAVLAFFGALLLAGDREPKYNGHRLSYWLVLQQKGWDSTPPAGDQSAEQAVGHIGTNALPWLLKWARYEEPAWRTKAYYSLSRLPSNCRMPRVEQFFGPVRPTRPDYMAGNGFMILGARAGPAIPDLERIIREYKTRLPGFTAIFCLGCIGNEARPLLASLAASPDPKISRAAKVALMRTERNAETPR